MRGARVLLFALAAAAWAAPLDADPAARQRLIQFFGGWYSYFPNSRISVRETAEASVPGYEVYRVARRCESKLHEESNIALYDRARDEIFVGDVFHDSERRAANRPFDEPKDLPNVQASLQEAFGLPVRIDLGQSPVGALRSLTVSIREEKEALATRAGFVSMDGATVLLGEFHPLAEGAEFFREKLLKESSGVRPEHSGQASFSVTEFLDFQCERCRVRTPAVRKFVEERGGILEIRFLPLTKVHDWAFAAAEAAAALVEAKPSLYSKYEETVFARSEVLSVSAVREIGEDIAEAAGVKAEFEAELSSGRARERVLHDIALAMRLGISGTPSFIEAGTFVSGEKDLLEAYLREKLEKPAAAPAAH